MPTPRIILRQTHAVVDRLTARWYARYGIAMGIMVLAGGLAMLGRASPDGQQIALPLFVGVLAASAIGGLGPGLVATALALVSAWQILPAAQTIQLRALAIQCLLVSAVGGALRSTRLKARQRLEANLRLEQQVLEISDDERRRIGHDLHDGLGQHLTGISLLSETMAQQLQSGRQPDPANVETITRLVSQAVGITRDLAKSLSPVTLERDGLVAALEELAETTSALFNINCTADFDEPQLVLDRARSQHLYRIVQEAVNNSIRHGKARNVRITLRRPQRDLLAVTIVDDGSGLSSKTTANPGLGLRIMEYRARMLGASLTVERASEAGGTVVTCCCPLNGPASSARS